MKIFSWVHRKFHNNVLKEGANYGDAKKEDLPRKSSETKVLLKQISLVDMHEGWKDGILSIGTFGFEDPFEPFKGENEKFTLLSGEQKQKGDDYDEPYLSNEDDFSDEFDSVSQEDQLPQLVIHSSAYVPKQDMQGTKPDEVRALNAASLHASSTEGDVKKKGGRVTLADLFMADSDMKKSKYDHGELLEQDGGKKASFTRKNSKSFVKKLVFGGKEKSIKKFQKLVKRMLKKKIHPELGGKTEKSVMFKPSVPNQLLNEEEVEVSEYISLLQSQGFFFHREV